jgi:Transmembrane domain of unknown function (DUF3566)
MALDNRADVVTTVDDGDLDGRGDAVEATNGAPLPEAAVVDDAPADEPAGTNGSGHDDSRPTRAPRPGRKRTARQRALLVAGVSAGAEETATTDGATRVDDDSPADSADGSSPVDPLLAGSAAESTDTGTDSGDDWSAESAGSVTLPPGATAAAAVAAAMYAPAPPRTAPVALPTEPAPTTAVPALNGQPETQVLEPVPSPPATVVPPPPRPRRRARPRVRKVTRVVRSVDAWSVFKVAFIFFLAMGVVLVTAGVLLWNLAQSTGTLDNVEGFFREAFGYDTFELQSEPLFRAGLTLTALFVVAGTGLTVVMAVLFNLIADLTGGIRLTVLEREVIARDDVVRRRRRRRRVTRPAKPAVSPVSDLPAPPPLEPSRPPNG